MRRVKHAAVDADRSLSEFVEVALEAYLRQLEEERVMRVLPIRYCADMAESTRFYRALGLELGSATRPGRLGGAAGGGRDPRAAPGRRATPATASWRSRRTSRWRRSRTGSRAAGYAPEPIVDESYGRSLRVRDPDGVVVQVNENDRALYT